MSKKWWVCLLAAAVAMALVMLAGCAQRPLAGGSGGSAPAAGADLIAMGHTCVGWGVLAVILGSAGWVVVKFLAAGNPIVRFIDWLGGEIVPEFLAIGGAISIACGCALIFLGHYFVYVVSAALLALVAWGWHRRRFLWSWIRHWLRLGPEKAVAK